MKFVSRLLRRVSREDAAQDQKQLILGNSSSAALCAFCAGLFQKEHPILRSDIEVVSFDLAEIYQDLAGFQEAVKQKCCLCLLRWKQLSSEEQGQVMSACKRIDLSISGDLEEKNIHIMFAYRLEYGGRRAKSITKTIILIPDEEIGQGANPHVIQSSTASVNTIAIIKWWLDRCEREHLACMWNMRFRGSRRLPTRLIDLGTTMNAVPVLCKGSNLPIKTDYMTLSHCWGTYEPIKLTSQNIAEMEASLPAEALSKTFQDAIFVARHLSCRYLWIDSLCIIQDSISDWEFEASLMKNIYQKAFLNIAATASADGRGGCFYQRDPILVAPHTVELSWKGLWRGKYHLIDRDLWKDEVLNAPLGERGWVLQERLLSPRMVHFGRNQVFWECQTAQSCETYPAMLPAPMLSVPGVWLNLNSWYDDVRYSGAGDCPKEFLPSVYTLWNRIVQAYSQRAFTHYTDRLIALSGVAAVVSTMTDHRYLAGLWDKTLPRSLLWSVNDPRAASRPLVYTAPSWSWASIIGEVTFPPNVPLGGAENNVAVVVLNAETSPTSADRFGQVTGGFIQLRAALMPVIVCLDGRTVDLGYKDSSGNSVTATIGADVGMFVEGQKLHCLPIYLEGGLCLELNGDMDGRYRRLGWWAMDHPETPLAVAELCEKFKPGTREGVAGQVKEVERDLGDYVGIVRWVISLV